MRKLAVGIGIVVVIIALLFGWRRCGSSSDGETSSSNKSGKSGVGQTANDTRSAKAKAPPSPATLSGRVTKTSDGSGIAGAIVSVAPAELMAMIVKSESPTITAITDANGAWQAKVSPGSFVVAATATGFLPAKRTKITVSGGESKTGVDLALEAGGTVVKGTVTDVGGGPIGDARVTAVEDRRPDLSGRADFVAVTKSDGTYELTLPDGSFRATASHDDYTERSQSIEVEGKPLTVDFELIPGSVIRGKVIARASNQPVPGALIRAEGGRGSDPIVRADDEGSFVMRSLGPGTIQLTALGRGYASTNPTEVAVGIGETVDNVRIYVDRAFSISGTVVKKGKTDPISGVTLGAFSIAAQTFGLALEPSAADGTFEIVGLRPASYLLFAVGEGSVPDIGKTVDVVDKDVTDVKIELATGATLSGRVEPPIAKVAISIELQGSVGLANMFEAAKTFLVHGETDATGGFTLRNVPAGNFNVVAEAPEGHEGKLAVTVADVDQANLLVKLDPRATLSGRVVDTNGKPVAGATVDARPSTPSKTGGFRMGRGGSNSAETAADGTFRIVGLEAGKTTVTATLDWGERFRVITDKDKQKDKLEVDLVAGKEKTGITLTVEARDGVIRGTVLAPDHQPAADSWVVAHFKMPEEDEKLRKEFGGSSRRWGGTTPVLTGPDGRFEIKKLKKGTYDVEVEGPRGATRAEKPNVKTGDTITIQLASLGTISGKVTAGGQPVTDYEISCDGVAQDKSQSVQAADGAFTIERLAPGAYECTIDSASGSAKDKIDVPAGPVQHDFVLKRWASITGTVINVLTKQPVSGVYAFAGEKNSSRTIGEIISGRAPVTDKTGKFVVGRVAAGTGELAIQGKDNFEPAAKRPYTVTEGQQLDLGTIEIVAPRTGDAGTFGLATTEAADHLVVSAVTPDTPAGSAGIKEGDKIMAINGIPVAQLTPPIAKLLLSSGTVGVGVTVMLKIDRAGTPVDTTLVSIRW